MAVLEKIRVKFGILISVVIALALLSFIIDPNTISQVANSMSSEYRVGKINGNAVSYQDFDKELNDQNRIFEIMYRRNASSDQEMDYVRNMAWQNFVDRYMFLPNAKKAGIQVGDAELVDLCSGNMVSPMVSQLFVDETGAFSTEMLDNFIKNMKYDQSGQSQMIWKYIQNTVLTSQYYTKYNSLFTDSDFINPLMMTNEIADNNNSVNVEFIMLPYGYQRDSTVEVSDSEIRAYYKKHKKLYRQSVETRDIEYVVVEVKPSDEDIAAANKLVTDVYDEFATTDNMKNFLLKNSDRQLSTYYYKRGELNTVSSDINDFVFNDGKGASKVFTKGNTFYVARVMDTKMIPDSVYVRHILLQGEQESLSDSLVNVIKSGKESFANVAALYSADQNTSAPERGDIGWMTQTYMIPGFESVMTAKLNTVFTLDTQYGKHIVEVTRRTEPVEKKQVAILEREALASKETFNTYYAKANAVATNSEGKFENFHKAAEAEGLYAHPMNRMLESSDRLGSIDDTKEVTRWAFEQKKPGKVSNIITVNNNYFFVVAVTGVHKEGYAKVSDVASGIRSVLYAEKRGEKVAAEVAEKIKGLGSMEAIASALETTVSTKEGITFSSMASQGLDPKFIGAVSVAEPGKISAPLAGNIGVYVYKVTAHDTGAFFTEDDAKARDAQMAQYSLQMLVPVMMQDADVTDNRARFY